MIDSYKDCRLWRYFLQDFVNGDVEAMEGIRLSIHIGAYFDKMGFTLQSI